MDIIQQINQKISTLAVGETWKISAKDLWLSHSDFHSISVYLSRESEKGQFSINLPVQTALTHPLDIVTVTKH